MRFACRITKARLQKHFRLIVIAFQRQQWLCERASVLRYTYIACRVNKSLLQCPYLRQSSSVTSWAINVVSIQVWYIQRKENSYCGRPGWKTEFLPPHRKCSMFFGIFEASTWRMVLRVKIKWSRYRRCVAQRVGRGIALLFHDRGTRRGWVVSSTPRPLFTPGKDPLPILQEAGWAPGPVWTGGKSRPGIRFRTVQPVVSRNSSLQLRLYRIYWS